MDLDVKCSVFRKIKTDMYNYFLKITLISFSYFGTRSASTGKGEQVDYMDSRA